MVLSRSFSRANLKTVCKLPGTTAMLFILVYGLWSVLLVIAPNKMRNVSFGSTLKAVGRRPHLLFALDVTAVKVAYPSPVIKFSQTTQLIKYLV